MYLHEQSKDLFEEMIAAVSQMAKVRVDIVEKDYYVTMILQELSKQELPIVFKGGTSLSKAYGVGEVREHRLSLGPKIAPAADFNVNIRQLSEEISSTAFYKQDYNDTTVFLISERISYEEVIERYLEVVKKAWK